MQILVSRQLSLLLGGQLPHHVVQDAPVLVVGQLQVGVEPADHGELLAGVCADGDFHAGGQGVGDINVKLLLAREPQALGSLSLFVLQGDDAHAHQVAPVDPLIALGDNSLDPKQEGSLGSPVSAGATPIVLPSQDDQVCVSGGVLLGSIKHVKSGPRGNVDSLGSGLPDKLVNQPDVAKGAPGHHGIISSPGAERVEVPWAESSTGEISRGWRVPGDGASGGDVVSGHGVTEVEEGLGCPDRALGGQVRCHPLEEWRMLDVGGGRVPGVQDGGGGGQLVPVGVPSGDLGVNFLK